VSIGDLIKSGKLLKVHCSSCRPARHLYPEAGSLDGRSRCRCRRWPTISPTSIIRRLALAGPMAGQL
jgi:hypothetical protein